LEQSTLASTIFNPGLMESQRDGGSDMAVDMFLKLDGIKGESQDNKHKDEIDVLSWSWGGVQSAINRSGGGGGSGKVNFNDLQITKYVDASSPLLIGAMAKGDHIKEALLTIRKAGGDQQEYIKMTMKQCLVSSIQSGASGGEDRLTENISLNFAEFVYNYAPQKPDGTLGANIPFGYNLAKNMKI
jgi:type VI secretion system secreted protein Hcp